MAISKTEEQQLNMMNEASRRFNNGAGLGTTVKAMEGLAGAVAKPTAITDLASEEPADIKNKVNEIITLLKAAGLAK